MRSRVTLGLSLACGALAACSGGGSSGTGSSIPSGGSVATVGPTTAPTSAPISTQQVISLALPTTSIGRITAPAFGLLGGYTQTTFSQILGFVPGAKVMIRNGQANAIPHTLGVIAGTTFPSGQPSELALTRTASNTLAAGWQSGTINAGGLIGPITLTAGTFLIGCAYHYAADTMRDVLVVAANATPGPQATAAPNASTPQPVTSSAPGPTY